MFVLGCSPAVLPSASAHGYFSAGEKQASIGDCALVSGSCCMVLKVHLLIETLRVQLLVAYGADVAGMEDHTALLEVSAFSLFLELDDAVSALLQQCNSLNVDLDQPLSQGVPPRHNTVPLPLPSCLLGPTMHDST